MLEGDDGVAGVGDGGDHGGRHGDGGGRSPILVGLGVQLGRQGHPVDEAQKACGGAQDPGDPKPDVRAHGQGDQGQDHPFDEKAQYNLDGSSAPAPQRGDLVAPIGHGQTCREGDEVEDDAQHGQAEGREKSGDLLSPRLIPLKEIDGRDPIPKPRHDLAGSGLDGPQGLDVAAEFVHPHIPVVEDPVPVHGAGGQPQFAHQVLEEEPFCDEQAVVERRRHQPVSDVGAVDGERPHHLEADRLLPRRLRQGRRHFGAVHVLTAHQHAESVDGFDVDDHFDDAVRPRLLRRPAAVDDADQLLQIGKKEDLAVRIPAELLSFAHWADQPGAQAGVAGAGQRLHAQPGGNLFGQHGV